MDIKLKYNILNPNSLKVRVLVWFVGATSVVLLLFSFLLYYFLEKSITLKLETNLYHKAAFVKDTVLNSNFNKERIENPNLDGFEVAIVKNSKIFKQTKRFTLKNYQPYFHKTKPFFINRVDDEQVNALYILKIKKPFNGAIVVYKKGLSNKFDDIQDTLLVLNPMLLLLLTIIGSKVIDQVLIPIKNITQTAKEITINNFSGTIETPKSSDEIKELIDSFNGMILRLKDGVDTLDRFNNDVSHELKTPLTIMQGELELALKHQRDTSYYNEALRTVFNQTKTIQKLIDALLLLTKYSQQNIQKTFSLCNLDALLMDTISKYQKELEGKNITLHIHKIEPIKLRANQILISSIFNNLIDNAIKYTPKGKNISISLFKKERVYFTIQDEGIGIPKNKIDKITNRFYRVDESRSKNIQGFGLGLSIVQNSVKLHNGILQIESWENKGTIVTVVLS